MGIRFNHVSSLADCHLCYSVHSPFVTEVGWPYLKKTIPSHIKHTMTYTIDFVQICMIAFSMVLRSKKCLLDIIVNNLLLMYFRVFGSTR